MAKPKASEGRAALAHGVSEALDFWLSQHEVTVSEVIGDAVRSAVEGWLEAHAEEVIAAASGRNLNNPAP